MVILRGGDGRNVFQGYRGCERRSSRKRSFFATMRKGAPTLTGITIRRMALH